ncbi:MAG: methionyl-tRNA formyltransferase [Rubrobacter sp.]|nr:methionyl-tRNA formyltransferase [Rubrobacter sp.]
MKLAFAGTSDFAATILRGLITSDHEVDLVISQPDRPHGRGRKLLKLPVAEFALARGLRLLQPDHIGEVAKEIAAQDALVVAAYGQILRPDTLYAAPEGAWNVHASLLPAYRGAAPVERAIIAGETETGVTIIRMDEGLDTGPIALQYRTSIPPEMTGGELAQTLANLGAKAVVEVMSELEKKSLTLANQHSLDASYAPKLKDEERVIRWHKKVDKVHDLVRALTPHLGARTFHPKVAGPIKVLRSKVLQREFHHPEAGAILPAEDRIMVACGEGVLEILKLQAPGRTPLSAEDFLRGRSLSGTFLS